MDGDAKAMSMASEAMWPNYAEKVDAWQLSEGEPFWGGYSLCQRRRRRGKTAK